MKIGYCLQCKKEKEIIVEENIIIDRDFIKTSGRCIDCGEYICIIKSLLQRNLN